VSRFEGIAQERSEDGQALAAVACVFVFLFIVCAVSTKVVAIPYNMPFERIASPGLVPPSPPPASGWPGGPSWGHPAFPRRGACFYQEPNFGGSYFCMRAGMSYTTVPPGFNDRITSIRVMGADVAIFNDTSFRGVGGRTRRDVANLRRWRLPTDPSRTWNDRISSIQVR
jgi:hypothetical protein